MAEKTMSDFYTQLAKTGVRLTHQFQMSIESLQNIAEFANITLWAESVNLPGRTLEGIEVPYFGYKFSVPGVTQMTTELNLSIRCDAPNKIRNAFLNWQKIHSSIAANISDTGINSLDSMSGGGSKKIPNTNIHLDLLDETMQLRTQTYVLFGAWPSSVGDINLSHDNPEVAKFDVTIKYQYYSFQGEGLSNNIIRTAANTLV